MFVLATLAMWAVRILVKTIYDVSASDSRAMRVLIYGALAGGVGLAKNIRSQSPQRFLLKGFISQDRRYRHNLLMGEKVFTLDDCPRCVQTSSVTTRRYRISCWVPV